jgi:hypothetical protein
VLESSPSTLSPLCWMLNFQVIVWPIFEAFISYFAHVLVVWTPNRVLSFALVYFHPKEPF